MWAIFRQFTFSNTLRTSLCRARTLWLLGLFLVHSIAFAQVGSIQIIEDSRPNNGRDFSYAWAAPLVPPLTNFILDDDTNATRSNTQTFAAVPVGTYSLSQTTVGGGWQLLSISCTGDLDNGNVINLVARNAVIDLDSGEAIVCTYVNAQLPTLVLRKVSRIAVGTFNFTITNADTNLATAGNQSAAAITTVTAGTAVTFDANTSLAGSQNSNILSYGAPIIVSELQAAGFALQTVAGTTCSVTNGTATVVRNIINDGTTAGTITITNMVPGNVAQMRFNCLFDNGTVANIGISITDGVTTVNSGAQTIYVITATNNGPGSASGAQLRSPIATGLTCTSLTCSALGGAVCPVGLTVGQLQTGVAIPTLPNGGSVTVNLTCSVTATGF